MSTEESQKKGYEVTDAKTSPVVVSLVVLVLLMVAGFIGGALFKSVFEATELKSRPEASPLVQREKVSGPLLQAHPEVELKAYLDEQRHIQTSYGWVDKARKRVRIPIEAAIAIVARDGFPTWTADEAKLSESAPAAPEPSQEAVTTPPNSGVEPVEQPAPTEATTTTVEAPSPTPVEEPTPSATTEDSTPTAEVEAPASAASAAPASAEAEAPAAEAEAPAAEAPVAPAPTPAAPAPSEEVHHETSEADGH